MQRVGLAFRSEQRGVSANDSPDGETRRNMHGKIMEVQGQSVALNFTPPCQNDQFWSDPASNPYTPILIPQSE